MSRSDENEIQRRLKTLSEIEPSTEATRRAVEKVRGTLIREPAGREFTHAGTQRSGLAWRVLRAAAVILLLIGLGYVAGRLSPAQQVDIEGLRRDMEASLRASLEPSIRESLLEQMNSRWESAFTVNCARLKEELHQQVRRDLTQFAAETMAASRNLTEQRLVELVQVIEAARMQDRRRVAAALEQMELNRLRDKTAYGNGLETLAAQTNELLQTKPY